MQFLQQCSVLHTLLLLLLLKQMMWHTAAGNLAPIKPQQQNAQATQSQQQQQPTHANVLHHQSAMPALQHQQAQAQTQSQPRPLPLPQQQFQQSPHYEHEKDAMQDIIKDLHGEEDIGDAYQLLSELKQEARLPSLHFPWQSYSSQQPLPGGPTFITPAAPSTPFESYSPAHATKMLPFFGFPQPIFIPYPFFVTPDMYLSGFNGFNGFNGNSNDVFEESMARAASGRPRPAAASSYARNSPIYYVRMPPTPYMFLPSLGFAATPTPPPPPAGITASAFGAGFPAYTPYTASSGYSPFSSVFNLPVNFMANGKPSNIFQVGGSPNDIQSALQFSGINDYGNRHPPLPTNPYRPASTANHYLPPPPSYSLPAPPAPHHESKLTSLKRPFIFNGRPDDIYILPNNYNSVYADNGYY